MSFMELARFVRLRQYEKAAYFVIGSYLDESFDPKKSGVFTVGGLLGRGVAFFELERKWEKLRKRPDIDILCFKANQCERGEGEFKKFCKDPRNLKPSDRAKLLAIKDEFLDVIGHEVVIAYGVGIIQDDFYEVIKDTSAKAVLGDNPYWLAYAAIMMTAAWAMKKLATGDRVSFVCDEHKKYSPVAAEAYRFLKEKNPKAAAHMATFSSAEDTHCEPLQAADAIAYEIRKAIHVAIGLKARPLRPQFDKISGYGRMFMIQTCNKENLENIVKANRPGEPLDLTPIFEQDIPDDADIRF